MADTIDQAQQMEDFYRQAALNQSLKEVPTGLFSGECWFCGDPVDYPRRWCSKECCDDWEMSND